jgi:hypothetical protein
MKKTYALRFNEKNIDFVDNARKQKKLSRSAYIENLITVLKENKIITKTSVNKKMFKMETETNRENEFRNKELQRLIPSLIKRLSKCLMLQPIEDTLPGYWRLAEDDVNNILDYAIKLEAPEELMKKIIDIQNVVKKNDIKEFMNFVIQHDNYFRKLIYHIALIHNKDGKKVYDYLKGKSALSRFKASLKVEE